MFNANPVLSRTRVLKTIPKDSPQLTRQNETRAMIKYIDVVRCRFAATSRRESRRLEAISNGTSRIRYVKKNEFTEYAPSAYSCGGISKRHNEYWSTVPCKRHLVPSGIGQRSATVPQSTLKLR